jgi:aspartate dehydrogenase
MTAPCRKDTTAPNDRRALRYNLPMKRIGILGCGNISALLSEQKMKGTVTAVFDRHEARAVTIAEKLRAKPYTDFEAFAEAPYDLVIEAASVEAVRMYAQTILARRCAMVILSAGALADGGLMRRLEALAQANGGRLFVPSGALFGLDNAKVAAYGGAEEITMRSTKPPRSFEVETDAPRCLFKGDAVDAVKAFPRNVNAAVALSIAARHPVELELWADPGVSVITHEVRLSGAFGSATFTIENRPSPGHPSTSFLAALSVVALVNTLDDTLRIGT